MICTNLIGTKAKKIDGNTIAIEFKNTINSFARTVLEKEENKEEIEKLLSKKENKRMVVKYIENTESANIKKEEKIDIETLAKNSDIPINIIEE